MATHPNIAADLIAHLVASGPYTVASESKALVAAVEDAPVEGQNIFAGPERAARTEVPDFAVFVLAAPGQQPEDYCGSTDNFHRFQLDVLVRSEAGMWSQGDELAREISDHLRLTTPAGYVKIDALSSMPAYAGEDDARRHRFTLGVELWWRG